MLVVLQVVKTEVAVPADVPEGIPGVSELAQSQSEGEFSLPVQVLQKDVTPFHRGQIPLIVKLSLEPTNF